MKWKNKGAKAVFERVLDRTKVLIHTNSGDILRDLRTGPFSTGLTYYGKSKLGWYSAFIRLDDAESADLIDAKADVLMGMYYAESNVESTANGWAADTPIMVVDGVMFGAYRKELLVDGKVVYSYRPGVGSFWLHYNLKTGEGKVVQ
jgi:hypothetical protein